MNPIQPQWTVEKAKWAAWACRKASDETWALAEKSRYQDVKARLRSDADELSALAEELNTLIQAAVNTDTASAEASNRSTSDPYVKLERIAVIAKDAADDPKLRTEGRRALLRIVDLASAER